MHESPGRSLRARKMAILNNVTAAEQHKRMTETPVLPLTVSLALPALASQLVTVIYNTADTWFVSQIDTSASAAVGAAFALQSLIQAFGYGFGMGAGSLVSRRLGAKKKEDADVIASSAFAGAVVTGLLIAVFGLVSLEPLMKLLGSTPTMLPYACDYARYILIAAPVMCGAFVLNIVTRSSGDATRSMIGLCAGGILNILLDPLFIFVFDMKISGAALATALSQLTSFVILGIPYVTKKSVVSLSPAKVSKNFGVYYSILSTGFPTICRQGLASLSAALMNRCAGVYGDAAVSAMSISYKVYLLVRNATLGIGQGFQTVAGYNYGAGNKKRTKDSFKVAVVLGTAMCMISGAFVALFPGEIMSFFRKADPDVIEIGKTALLYACAVIPFMAYSTYVNQLYQCLGFRVRATILASCRQGLCFLPLVLLLPGRLGLTGVQLLQPGADFLTFLVSVPFQIVFFRKYLNDK
ncbi:MAG: MATE family efflux transporter [Clostridia bacterium]|nr:MATE family efflux transporter [Clostridia bacterium]